MDKEASKEAYFFLLEEGFSIKSIERYCKHLDCDVIELKNIYLASKE